MTYWTRQRGVYLYRPRLGLGNRTLDLDEPEFPWHVVPVVGLGFVLFFAGLALMGLEAHALAWLLATAGMAMFVAGFAVLVRRFL